MTTINLEQIKYSWKNTWANNTAYVVRDTIYGSPHSYVCITAHTSHASDASLVTSDSAYWSILTGGDEGATFGGDISGTASNAQIAAGVVGTTEIATDAVTANEIAAGAVGTTEIATNAVTVNELATTLDFSSNTVIVPAATVTAHVPAVDVTAILDNIALLGLKAAAAGALARYNLIDQVIDEFTDNSGMDTANTVGGNVSGYWSGQAEISTGFAYTGSDQTFTLNSNTSTIDFWLWGAGSGSGISGWGGNAGHGAGGGATTGTIAGTMPATLKIMVGQGGPSLDAPLGGGVQPYGHAGHQDSGYTGYGGGLSGIFLGSTGNQADMICCAGGAGGGGCGWNGTATNLAGGAGGGESGGNGGYGGGASDRGGKGGSQTAAGAGGTSCANENGVNGSGMNGGPEPGAYGGSGGGGYWGGGSGGYSESSGRDMTGGGGGSGFVNTTGVSGTTATGTLYAGSTTSPGLSGHAKLPGNVGYGASSANQPGQNGYIEVLEKINEDGVFISNATTATTQPTSADLIMLYSDGAGTAVLNTDLKGYVSRDDGTTWTQATLVAQSIAGGQTVILAHDIDVSSQPAGTSMRWKVTTHNQGTSLDTRLHGVSLGWG